MISFVIPVYNGEKYISRCLDSIISQTYDNYEIVIINDGSTDSSLSILNKYCSTNDKILLKSTTNKGHGAARNLGIKLASSDYIWFVDIDDYLYDNNSLARVVKNLEQYNPDIHIFSILETNHSDRNKIWNFTLKPTVTNFYKRHSLAFIQQWSWNKVINRKFLLDSKVKFNNLKMFEDIYFFLDLYLRASKIYISKEVNYVYVKHSESLTAIKKNFKGYPKALFTELLYFFRSFK